MTHHDDNFSIRFWGVRGSIASPGPSTQLVGGNTSCVEVRCGDTTLILDAGTGLRGLGDELMKTGARDVHLLLSHLHWDHIQGLPFFVPLYSPRTNLAVYGPRAADHSLEQVLGRQMTAPVFPVELSAAPAQLAALEIGDGSRFRIGDVQVRVARLHHPGGVLAYRVDYAGHALVYATDTEHASSVDPALVELARGANVLIYDAQYTPDEYYGRAGPAKIGWGHSTYEEGVKVAHAAGVGRLVLFHHDPRRSDAEVAEIAALARQEFPDTVAAREGMSLSMRGRRAA